jgi:PAS domain S-box-containing protein
MLRRNSRPTRQRQLRAGKDNAAALLTKLNAMEQRNAELEAMLAKEKRADDELEQQARRRTAEVSNSEARLQLALNVAAMDAWEWNILTGEVCVSAPAVAIPEANKFRTLDDFVEAVHPEDREAVQKAVEQAITGKGEYRVEFRTRGADGSIHIVEARGRALFDETGRATKLIGVGLDVTERRRAEEALRASERRFRALVENSWDGITILAADTTILYASPGVTRILGYGLEELVGRNGLALIHPDDMHRVREAFARLSESPGSSVIIEHRSRHRNGSWRWIEAVSANLLAEPEVRAIVCNFRDITKRRQTAEALRESEERFRVALKTSPAVVFNQDRDLRYTWVYNPSRGYSVDGVVGKTDAELLSADDAVRLTRIKGRVIETGIGAREEVELTSGGVRNVYDMNIEPLLNPHGQISGVTCVALDITDRKRAEEALRESEERFAAFMRNLPGAAFIKDLEGRYVYINEPCEKIFRKRTSEWLGKSDNEIWPAETAEQFKANDRILLSGTAFRTIETVPEEDGVHHWLVHKFPIMDKSGKPMLLAAAAVDITDQKRAEAELATRVRQHAAVAELGQRALTGGNVSVLLNDAVSVVAKTLGLDHCSALELLPSGDALALKAGVGWKPGLVGNIFVPADDGSPAGYALRCNEPLIFEDLEHEKRFKAPPVLLDHGIVSGAVVIIPGRPRPFGVFGAHSITRRAFTKDDVHFLQSVANVVATAIQRQLFEEQILEISEREQRRIGQDLHDGLCQQLTGIEFRNSVLVQQLAKQREAKAEAGRIGELIRDVTRQARLLAKGLSPMQLECDSLMSALEELTSNASKLFSVCCRFACPQPVLVEDNTVATHLYRIAQEAITNAVRHGHAKSIVVSLSSSVDQSTLRITDNGAGFLAAARAKGGLGLRIMEYRAEMIGATFRIGSANGKGTTVACTFKLNR